MEKQLADTNTIDETTWNILSEKAWFCQKKARVLGTTKVGAAALSVSGTIFGGCNMTTMITK